tara:strand:- start:582 stop:806 length:225 start_codon:yes stop_codon:yes gene_type:complete
MSRERESWKEFTKRIGLPDYKYDASDDIDTTLRRVSTYVYWSSAYSHEQGLSWRRHTIRIKALLTDLLQRVPPQ